ncbi:MAG: response regulator transcription factor [Spirochaetales bacterium]|jgi:two-component system alkaline phosphatase synthesis response regulator PhoP
MSSKKRILVVDDERHIVEFLVMNLRQNQYESLIAYDGYEAVRIARAESPDLILLDSMLPGMSGIETCRTLKQDEKARHIPIIFLTAKSEESDKVIGLGLGADDYITKPFGLRELFARIEAVLRRSSQDSPASAQAADLRIQDLAIHAESFTVEKKGEKIPLSPTEFSLLVILARNADKVVARKELMESLALASETAEGRSLDVHLRNLRRKLGESPRAEGYIDTVRGFGLKANS